MWNDNNKSTYSFETTDIQDKSVGLSNEKPTPIYFMDAWCPTCVDGEKVFVDLHDQYGDKIQLITVDVDPSMDMEENLAEFQEKYGGNWPHVLDKDQQITTQFQVKQLEEVYVINKDGEQVLHEINPSIIKLKKCSS